MPDLKVALGSLEVEQDGENLVLPVVWVNIAVDVERNV